MAKEQLQRIMMVCDPWKYEGIYITSAEHSKQIHILLTKHKINSILILGPRGDNVNFMAYLYRVITIYRLELNWAVSRITCVNKIINIVGAIKNGKVDCKKILTGKITFVGKRLLSDTWRLFSLMLEIQKKVILDNRHWRNISIENILAKYSIRLWTVTITHTKNAEMG